MVKSITLIIRISGDQDKLLHKKMQEAGFIKKSDYIRNILFRKQSMEEKVDRIFNKVCRDGRKL